MRNKKTIINGMIFILLISLFASVVSSAPKAYQFEDLSKTNSVNEYTGDMTLSLPLLTLPQPGGPDYPLTLNYHAGIKTDQMASWVGLGWDLGVDSISRQVSYIPDDALPNTANYRLDTTYPPTFPTSEFRSRMSELENAKLASRFQVGSGIAMSYFRSIATGNYFNSITAAKDIIQNEMYSATNTKELKREYETTKKIIKDNSNTFAATNNVGFMFSGDPSTSQNLDSRHPDSYFANTKVYEGPLVLLKSEKSTKKNFFVPTSYQGTLDVDPGTETDILSDSLGYFKKYINAMLTDTSVRLIGDLDTNNVDVGMKGFELVDESGNHHIFDEPIEKYVKNKLPGFLPGQARSADNQVYSEFTYTNWFPGDYNNKHQPSTLYKNDAGVQYGTASYLVSDYTSIWGISAITGPTFKDNSPTGVIGPSDTGSWIKFNYKKPDLSDGVFTQSNSQRISKNSKYYGLDEDFDVGIGGKKYVSRSFKTYKYLSSIESYSYKIDFNVSFDRFDGHEVFASGTGVSNLDSLPKLNSIVLKRRKSSGSDELSDTDFIELEKYEFKYDYSLVRGAPDNYLPTENQNSGRLTLKSITHSTCSSWNTNGVCTNWNALPPIEFEYANGESGKLNAFEKKPEFPTTASCTDYFAPEGGIGPCLEQVPGCTNKYYSGGPYAGSFYVCEGKFDSKEYCEGINTDRVWTNLYDDRICQKVQTKNPKYSKSLYDRWGYYFIPESNKNVHNHKGLSNPYVDAWSLTKVYWPTGGTTEWKYGQDRYKYLNDYYPNSNTKAFNGRTKFGGGIRVKSVTNCDGLGQCYTDSYSYKDTSISGAAYPEKMGNDRNPGESSGVATGEPDYPKYTDGDFAKLPNNYENPLIKAGIPGVGYSRVLTYSDDPKKTGVVEKKFTTPIYAEDGENISGKGYYTPDEFFNIYSLKYTPNQPMPSRGNHAQPVQNNDIWIGANFIIKDRIGEEIQDKMYVKNGGTYLVQSNKEGYLFFLRTNYYPSCYDNTRVQHPIDAIPIINESCPGGEDNVYCGSVTIENNPPPGSGCSEDHEVIFCTKDGIKNKLGKDLSEFSNWKDTINNNLQYIDRLGSDPWPFCYHVFGGDDYVSTTTNEYWEFTSDKNANECVDYNKNNKCDLLESYPNISMNKEIPMLKYGLNYETNIYSADDLNGDPISSSKNTYDLNTSDPHANIQTFKRGGLIVGSINLKMSENTQDGFKTRTVYSDYDPYTGVPSVVSTLDSNNKLKSSKKIFATTDSDKNFNIEKYHILNQVKQQINYEGTADHSAIVSATKTEFTPERNGLYLPYKKYVWKDKVGSGNPNHIDSNEWQKVSEITKFDDTFLRPVEVADAKGNVKKSFFNNAGNGECNGNIGIFLTCTEDAAGNKVKYEYDVNKLGQVNKITDANNVATKYTYDNLGRLSKVYLYQNTGSASNTPDLQYEYSFFNSVKLKNPGFEDGFVGWNNQNFGSGDSSSIQSTIVKGGTNAVKIKVGSGASYVGIYSDKFKLKPNTEYLVSADIYVPSSANIQGNFMISQHVLTSTGCSSGTCHHYTTLAGDSRWSGSIPRDTWVKKWTVIRTNGDAKTGKILIISDANSNAKGEFYVDNVAFGYPNKIKTKTYLGNGYSEFVSFIDGLGRTVQSQTKETDNSWIVSWTDFYDSFNLIKKAWNPKRENTKEIFTPNNGLGTYAKYVYYLDPTLRVKEMYPAINSSLGPQSGLSH